MLASVEFHHQAGFEASEVGDEASNGVLTAKSIAIQLPLPQMKPETGFGICHRAAKLAHECCAGCVAHARRVRWLDCCRMPTEWANLQIEIRWNAPFSPAGSFPRCKGEATTCTSPAKRGKVPKADGGDPGVTPVPRIRARRSGRSQRAAGQGPGKHPWACSRNSRGTRSRCWDWPCAGSALRK